MKDNKFEKLKLDEKILKAIDLLGFEELSEVQKEAIPYCLNNMDVIVKSQTGSGKTAAFGIPLCEKVVVDKARVQGLVLVPTRELAVQVKEEIGKIGRLKKVRVAAVFGKQSFSEQVKELKQRVHIVVGTPGRIIDHIERGTIDLSSINTVVIDEGDKMLNMGFIDQIRDILKSLPKSKNTFLFSATIPQEIMELCNVYMNKPKVLDVKSKVFNREKIKESYIRVESQDKLRVLKKLIYSENSDAIIIFCNTRDKVKEVVNSLKREKIFAEAIHGDMDQKDRIKVMERFKDREFKILVATDVAARGIHVDHITHVINYEPPMEKDAYVHRIGRTGRGDKSGIAISLVSTYEIKFLNQIEEYIGYSIKLDSEPDQRAVEVGKVTFKDSEKNRFGKKEKGKKGVSKEVNKIYINAGKKKKIRPLDIVGSFSNLDGLSGDDIGIIDVQDVCSFVDILNSKGEGFLRQYKELTIKGKKVKIQRAKK